MPENITLGGKTIDLDQYRKPAQPSFSNLDANVVRAISDNYKSTWKYQFDPEDIYRKENNLMPQSAEKKYNTRKYKYDQYLYDNGLPSTEEFLKQYHSISQEWAKQNIDFDQLDTGILNSIHEDYKKTWIYDMSDPEDMERQKIGAVPKSLEKKYDFVHNKYDRVLFENGQPSTFELYKEYQKKDQEQAELAPYMDLKTQFMNELYSKAFNKEMAEAEVAAAEGRGPSPVDLTGIVNELFENPRYAEIAISRKTLPDISGEYGAEKTDAWQKYYAIQEEIKNNPKLWTLEDIAEEYAAFSDKIKAEAENAPAVPSDTPESPEIEALKTQNAAIDNQLQEKQSISIRALGAGGAPTYFDDEARALSLQKYQNDESIKELRRKKIEEENKIVQPFKEQVDAFAQTLTSDEMALTGAFYDETGSPEVTYEVGGLLPERTEANAEIITGARQALEEIGVTLGFDQDNILKRNGITPPSKEEEYRNYFEARMAPYSLEIYNPEDDDQARRISLAMETDPLVQETPQTAVMKAVSAAPVSGAYSIAQGIVGAGEMISTALSGNNYVRPEWVESMYNIGNMIRGFGTTKDYTVSNLMFEVGSEVTRMYLTAGIGKAVSGAIGGMLAEPSGKGAGLIIKRFGHRIATSSRNPFIVTAMGHSYIQAMANGATPQQALTYGIVAGGIEGALESLGADVMFKNLLGKKVVDSMLKSGQTALMSKGAYKFVQVASSLVGNFAEEGSSYFLTGLSEQAIYNPEWKFDVEDFLTEAAMGALIGTLGAAFTSTGDAYTLYEQVVNEGVTPDRVDDLHSAVVEESLGANARELLKDAKSQTLEQSNESYNTVFGATREISDADIAFEATKGRYNAEVLKAESELEAAREMVAQMTPTSQGFADAIDSFAAKKLALRNIRKDTDAKIAAAQRDYDSLTAKSTTERKKARRRLHDQALMHNVKRRVAENADKAWNGIVPFDDVDARAHAAGNNVVANFTSLEDFINSSIGSSETRPYYFGRVSSELSDAIKDKTDVYTYGFTLAIRSDEIQHLFNQHGGSQEALRGQIPITPEALTLLPEVFNNPDEIILSNKKDTFGRAAIQFKKAVGGNMVVITGVNDRLGSLRIDSAWIINKKGMTHTYDAVTSPPPLYAQGVHETDPFLNNNPDQENTQVENNMPFAVGAAATAEMQQGKPVSQSYNTLRNIVGQETLDAAGYTEDDARYNVISEEFTQGAAQYAVRDALENGLTQAVDKLETSEAWTGVETDSTAALLNLAKDEARETGDYANFVRLAALYRERATEAGQGLQAFAKFARNTEDISTEGLVAEAEKAVSDAEKNAPFKIKSAIQEETEAVIQAFNGNNVESDIRSAVKGAHSKAAIAALTELYNSGDYNPGKIRDILKVKHGLPVLTDADIAGIMGYLDAAEQAEGRKKSVNLFRANQIVAKKKAKTLADQHRAIRRTFMLLNPKTGIKNFAANLPMALLENVKDMPSTLADIVVSKITGVRTTTTSPKRISAEAKAFISYTKNAFKDFMEGVNTTAMPGRYAEGSPDPFYNDTVLGRAMNRLNAVVGPFMGLGDKGAFGAAYEGRLVDLEKLGYDISDTNVQEDAWNYALDRVFQNNGGLAQWLASVRTDKTVGHLIVPFVQTPANIVSKLFDYTPVGLVRAFVMAPIQKYRKGSFDQKLLVDRIGRGLTGSSILLLGAALAKHGILKGSDDETPKERAAYQNAGAERFAIHIDGKSYSIDWMEPAGSLLLMGAAIYNMGFKKDEIANEGAILEYGDAALDATEMGINSFFNNGFVQGIANLFGFGNIGGGIVDALLGSSTQYTPSLLAAIAKVSDEYERETYDPNKLIKQAKVLASRFPVLRKLLPIKVGTDGRLEESGTLGERIFDNLSPGYLGRGTDDVVNQELFRLYDEGFTDQLLPVAAKTVGTVTLDAEQYHDYQIEYGTAVYDAAKKVFESSSYRSMPDDVKVEKLKKAIDAAATKVRDKWKKSLDKK